MEREPKPQLNDLPLSCDAQLSDFFVKIRNISKEAKKYGITTVFAMTTYDPIQEKDIAIWGGHGSDMVTLGLARCLDRWANDTVIACDGPLGWEDLSGGDDDGCSSGASV